MWRINERRKKATKEGNEEAAMKYFEEMKRNEIIIK